MIAQSEEELKENEKQDFISGVFDNEDGSSQTEIKREYSIELDYLTDFSIFATTRHKERVDNDGTGRPNRPVVDRQLSDN